MATQISTTLLRGGIDNLVYYMLNGKPVVRKNGSASGKKIKRDARYVRFRENAKEFGQSVKAAGELFYGLRPLLHRCADNQVRPRLNAFFCRITKSDNASARGERRAALGLLSEEGKAQLRGF